MVSLRFQTVRESWSTAEVTGKPLLANRQSYMATCHKGAMVIMGGAWVPGPVIVNGECKIHAAEVVQCIRPRPAAPVVDAPDVAVMRYDLARDMKCMLDRQTLTDTSVTVEGLHERWQVHRIVLASASPVFRQAFECDAAHLDCDQQVATQCNCAVLIEACHSFMQQVAAREPGSLLAQELRTSMIEAGLVAPDKVAACTSFAIDPLTSHPTDDLDDDDAWSESDAAEDVVTAPMLYFDRSSSNAESTPAGGNGVMPEHHRTKAGDNRSHMQIQYSINAVSAGLAFPGAQQESVMGMSEAPQAAAAVLNDFSLPTQQSAEALDHDLGRSQEGGEGDGQMTQDAHLLLAEASMAIEGNAGPVPRSRAGFRLGGFGWGLARGAVKAAATTLCTVAIAALADKHTCHSAQKHHRSPLPASSDNKVAARICTCPAAFVRLDASSNGIGRN
ncbi:hypothetical protein WJX82_001931 [Trebouxia sp. C0006]